MYTHFNEHQATCEIGLSKDGVHRILKRMGVKSYISTLVQSLIKGDPRQEDWIL
jgi:hypothetical protein